MRRTFVRAGNHDSDGRQLGGLSGEPESARRRGPACRPCRGSLPARPPAPPRRPARGRAPAGRPCTAGDAGPAGGDQRLPGPAEGRSREQLVAVDQVEQRLRLAAQGVDHMAVVGHAPKRPCSARTGRRPRGRVNTGALPRKHSSRSSVQPHTEPVTHEPGRHGVERLAEQEPAVAGDGDQRLLVVGCAAGRQPLQQQTLDIERLAPSLCRVNCAVACIVASLNFAPPSRRSWTPITPIRSRSAEPNPRTISSPASSVSAPKRPGVLRDDFRLQEY